MKDVLAINFVGAISTILAAQQPMLARGRGHIVVVSSLAGELALPVAPEYGATKAGLSYYVEAMRHDLARHGVRVTLVHPGFVKSEMTEQNAFAMPFIVETDAAAALIVHAIRRRTARLRFPLAYRLAFALAAILPRRLIAHLAIQSTRSGPQGMARRG